MKTITTLCHGCQSPMVLNVGDACDAETIESMIRIARCDKCRAVKRGAIRAFGDSTPNPSHASYGASRGYRAPYKD